MTDSSGYGDKLLECGVPVSKLEIVTNGADLKFYCPGEPDNKFRQQHDLAGKFTVAYVEFPEKAFKLTGGILFQEALVIYDSP